nr:7133_t:CDS:2 [Entrophospora candida]
MRLIVEQKFRQHDNLKNLLLSTGDRPIIEDTESKILMELRTKIKNEETPEPPPPDPLASLKNDTITQINREMSEDPEIETSELQDADIDTKRKEKKLAKNFQKLISQAQQAMRTGNSATLSQLLIQIYDYREYSKLYSQHENEIRQWKTYVNQQDINSFKILQVSAINHLLQQEPEVMISELRETNRDFQQVIMRTSDFAEINHFERQVSDNIIEARTEKRFDQLLVSARNAKSEEEKSLVIQEIYK